MNFFKKALKSLEAVEPHVQFITVQQHIDYPFDGLEDEGDEMDDDQDDNSYDTRDDGELSFDYGQSDQAPVTDSNIRRSMEVSIYSTLIGRRKGCIFHLTIGTSLG